MTTSHDHSIIWNEEKRKLHLQQGKRFSFDGCAATPPLTRRVIAPTIMQGPHDRRGEDPAGRQKTDLHVTFHPASEEGHVEERRIFMKEHRSLIKWIRLHKKELAIAGISIAALIAGILCVKNKSALLAYWAALKKALTQLRSTTEAPAATELPQQVVHTAVKEATPIIQQVTTSVEGVPHIAHHPSQVPFEVDPHIRNLPSGWHASPEKKATALENGFELQEGQTWVSNYVKGGAVA